MLNIFSFLRGLKIVPSAGSNTSAAGELQVQSDDSNNLQYHNGSNSSSIVTEVHANQNTHRLKNKDLEDSTTQIVDASDTTKVLKFDAAGTTGTSTTITSSQTTNRIQTLQNVTDTFIYRASTDTLTNKSMDGGSNTFTNLPTSALTGTVDVPHGGTGLSTLTANNVILGNGSSSPTFVAPGTSGNVLTSNGSTWNSSPSLTGGTVTSVALTVPSILNVSGSPITTSGTLAVTLATETANTLFSGPTNGSAAIPTFRSLSSSDFPISTLGSFGALNYGLAASVSANALTISLKQPDGSTDPGTGANAVIITQRSSTAATGGYVRYSITSALSVTVPAGESLGLTSGITQFLYVYLIDDSGTQRLAVSGFPIATDGSLQTVTLLGIRASAADQQFVLQSNIGSNFITGIPVRYLGKIQVNEPTAGTWSVSPTLIDLRSFEPESFFTRLDYKSIFANNLVADNTTATKVFIGRRIGNCFHVRGYLVADTPVAAPASLALPINVDYTQLLNTNNYQAGTAYQIVTTGPSVIGPSTYIAKPSGGGANIFFSFQSASSVFVNANATNLVSTGDTLSVDFIVPIENWAN